MNLEFNARVWMHRYVDDIISQVVVFFTEEKRERASEYAQRLLDDLMRPYGKYFDLKDENVDEFIGLKITDTEDDMFIEPLLFVSIGSE